MPMLKAERISCSGPKLSDAQTRNFEAIKHKYDEPVDLSGYDRALGLAEGGGADA